MVESQPGTVVAFNPSLTLTSFSAASRDRFMFNENQLVLAKVVRPLVTFATGYSGNPITNGAFQYFIPTYYDSYRNSEGDFVWADDLFFLSDASGVPTDDVHGVVVGFDFQVSTSMVKFWSTSFINSAYLSVDYSFDNDTWFSTGAVSWSYVFDDTIEIYPGESPASGQYIFTGTLPQSHAARYWRIKSQGQTTVTSATSSVITVPSTEGFPSTGSLSIVSITGGQEDRILYSGKTYTGKTSTTFTGMTSVVASPGQIVVLEEDLAPSLSNVTEVRIIQTTEPILEHWNSDGSQAVSVVVEGSQYYDICYDAADDVYYAIYFNDNPSQVDTVDPDDNFDSAAFGSGFDTTKWVESDEFPYFVHNTASGTLDMVSSAGGGLLEGNYGINGGYVATIDLSSVFTTNSGTAFCLASEDYTTGNQELVVGIKGAYAPPTTYSGSFVGAVCQYSNTIGSAASLRDFHINPHFFAFGTPGNSLTYAMTYSLANDNYNVTVGGSPVPPATPGVPYTGNGTASFTISNVFTPADGQGFTVNVICNTTPIVGTAISGMKLELERSGTTGRLKYVDSNSPATVTLYTATTTSGTHRPYIVGHPGPYTPNVRTDNYLVTSGTIVYDTPVFSVVAINKDGQVTTVSNVTDGSGFAIKNFDIIRNPQAGDNDFIYPYTSIATNGALYGSGGEIYIKIGTDLYKYTKAAALPITHEPSNTPTASVKTTGEIPADGITGFAYNGFTQAGLSYLKYEESLSGVFLKTINTTNLLANAYKSKLDVASINYPFAWNVSDLSTLYYVSGTSLYLYDMNETKAAFVNVSSDKQVLAAGTAETATITAQVLNVYGIPKSAKTMTFSVSAGDGAVSPAIGCSNGSGEDTTIYTVGSAVGTATITVSCSDVVCVP